MLNTELSPAFTNMTGANSFPQEAHLKKKKTKKEKFVACKKI